MYIERIISRTFINVSGSFLQIYSAKDLEESIRQIKDILADGEYSVLQGFRVHLSLKEPIVLLKYCKHLSYYLGHKYICKMKIILLI